jgi:hypothetical protein
MASFRKMPLVAGPDMALFAQNDAFGWPEKMALFRKMTLATASPCTG